MLHLAPSTPSKRKKRCITTNPLVTTRRFDQRRFGIAAEATMLARYRFGFPSVLRHGLLGVGLGFRAYRAQAHQVQCTAHCSILSSWPVQLPPLIAVSPWGLGENVTMSQLFQAQTQLQLMESQSQAAGSDHPATWASSSPRVKAERDQAKQDQSDQSRLRQL
jgi:hypothetical protein